MRVVLVRNLVSTGIIFAVTPGGSDKTSVGDAPISHQRLQTEKREWEPSDWLTFFVWVQEWSVQWKRKSRDTGSVHRRTDPVPLVCPQKLNSDQPIWSGVYPISTIRRPVSLLTAVVFFSPPFVWQMESKYCRLAWPLNHKTIGFGNFNERLGRRHSALFWSSLWKVKGLAGLLTIEYL